GVGRGPLPLAWAPCGDGPLSGPRSAVYAGSSAPFDRMCCARTASLSRAAKIAPPQATNAPPSPSGAIPAVAWLCVVRPSSCPAGGQPGRSEEHTSELQSLTNLVCRLLLGQNKPHPYERTT